MHQDRKTLPQSTADEIMAMIFEQNRFAPGSRLPTETALAGELFVSRSTLREAMRILSEREIIEVRRGLGTFVSNDAWSKRGRRSVCFSTANTDARELNEVRLMIEPEAAYFAAMRASDAEIRRIRDFMELVEKKIDANEDRLEAERLFHMEISRAAHNDFLDRVMPAVFEAFDKNNHIFSHRAIDEGTLLDHRMIMEYLQARNADAARTAMRLHMLRGIRLLEQLAQEKSPR